MRLLVMKSWISIPSAIVLVHVWKDAVFHGLSFDAKTFLGNYHLDVLIGHKYRNFHEKLVIFHIFQVRKNTLGHHLYLNFLLHGSVSNRSNQNTLFESKNYFSSVQNVAIKCWTLFYLDSSNSTRGCVQRLIHNSW